MLINWRVLNFRWYDSVNLLIAGSDENDIDWLLLLNSFIHEFD